MGPWQRRGAILGLSVGLLGTAMCVGEFDTTRRVPADDTTVGEEVFRIVCERVDVGENPRDVDFAVARPMCTGRGTAPDGGGLGDASVVGVGPKVNALGARRRDVVASLDRTFPSSLYDRADRLLVQLLPLYGTDDGTNRDGGTIRLTDGGRAPLEEELLPHTTRALANLLVSMAGDDSATGALARASLHQGYRPPRVALGLTRNLLGYQDIGSVMDTALALFRDEGQGRPAGAGNAHFNTLLDVARGELTDASPSTDPRTGTTLDATMDLLFRSDGALSTGRPRLLVRRDARGMPVVTTGPGGTVPAPFVDTDMDGLADAAQGHFVDRSGQVITAPSPFPANEAPDGMRDSAGRAMNPAISSPMYRYLDLDQTVMGALMRDAHTLLDPAQNTALRFLHGASVLLGPRASVTRDYMLRHPCPDARDANRMCDVPPVTYSQFNAEGPAPVVDFVHALGTALTSRNIDPMLTTVEALMSTSEGALARSLAAMLQINDVANAHPEATIDPRSNIWDDVIDVARRIAQTPGMLEDLLAAMADPHTQGLGRAFANFMRYRDRVEPVWTPSQQNASLAARTMTMEVDRSRPDTQNVRGGPDDNRSAFQRFAHLIADLNGVQICNKENAHVELGVLGLEWPIGTGYRMCELLQIDDAAVFFLRAIDGSAVLQMRDSTLPAWLARVSPSSVDQLLESQSGITGFTQHPTPEAMARFVFQPATLNTSFITSLVNPARTRDGLIARDTHPGTIFVFELYDFYASLRPLVHAFLQHGDAGGHLFVELVSALHRHWATSQAGQFQNTNPAAPLYSTMDGARRYEPILVEAFNGDLINAASSLMTILPTINAGAGMTGRDAIAALVRMLVDPAALSGIAYRDGRTATVRSDGTTPVTTPSLYYLFADAMAGMDTAFASAPSELDSWQTARSNLVDTFLTVDAGGTPGARFHNRNIPVVGRLLVRWLRDRIAAHRAVGDVESWSRGLSRRLSDVARGPILSSAVDMMLDLYNDVPSRAAAGGLLMHLMDDSGTTGDTALGTTLTAAADLLQILRDDDDVDPLLHALAPAFQRRMAAAGTESTPGTLREEVVPITLRFLDHGRTYDTERVLDTILSNVVSRPDSPLLADEPLVVFGDAIAETHRLQPGVGGPLTAPDFREVLTQVSDFFTDGTRGMEQFYYIVQHRRLRGTATSP